ASTDESCINSFLNRPTVIPLTGPLTPSGTGGETEVIRDIVTVMGVAPGANYQVYESCNDCPNSVSFQTLFNALLNNGVTVISNSWFGCEPEFTRASVTSIEAILQQAGGAGVSVFSASGDTGTTCSNGVDYLNTIGVPADAPSGVAVGGTYLQMGP